MRRALVAVAAGIDALNEAVGRAVAWLALAMVIVTFAVVVARYGAGVGSIAAQESVSYMHALLFMLGAAYTLKHDGHVRVDVLYQRLSPRGRAWVDLLGAALLLLPVAVYMLWASADYVADAWRLREGSRDAGGLPYVWLLKTALVIMPVLLALQGIAQICRALLVLGAPRGDG